MLTTLTTVSHQSSPYALLTAERQRSHVSAGAREQLVERLTAHQYRTRAACMLDEQRAERDAQRAARADRAAAEQTATLADAAAGNVPSIDALAAARRDRYREALSYPMTSDEVLSACLLALDDARLPDDETRAETLGALVLHVFERHGNEPMRADVGRAWLRQKAVWIYQDEAVERERATRLRETAQQLKRWHAEDQAAERDSAEQSDHPDALYYLAAGMAAPTFDRPLSAEQIGQRLQLSERQTAALALSLESQQRLTVALTDAENMAASRARATLRKRYPDAYTLRLALHPDRVYALAVDGAQRLMRERAAVAGYGSVLPAQRDSASTLPLARFTRPAAAERQPDSVTGPTTWYHAGNGYSGACDISARLTRWQQQ